MGINHLTLKHEKGKHLTIEERLFIQKFHNMDWSYYDLAVELDCSYNTIWNEMRRGDYRYKHYWWLDYNAWEGQKNYTLNRAKSHRPCKLNKCSRFVQWATKKFWGPEKWSFDACVGYAKRNHLFPLDEIPNTKTMYNWANKGLLEIKRYDLPKAIRRRKRVELGEFTQKQPTFGTCIEKRPDIVNTREEFGHWEIDTVIGKKEGSNEVLLTMTERKTRAEIIRKIDGKNIMAIKQAVQDILNEYHKKKYKIFRSITADNGTEFARLIDLENEHLKIYFAHPYSSYERGTNERHNRMIRIFIPKGTDISQYSEMDIEDLKDWMNNLPRKNLGYHTPEQMFESELDMIYKRTS